MSRWGTPKALGAPGDGVAYEARLARSWYPVMEAWLDRTADSPHTRRAYRHDVVTAMGGMGIRDLRELSGTALTTYRAQVVASTAAPATIARHLSGLRSFLIFAAATEASPLSGDLVRLALPLPRGRQVRAYPVLGDQELARLLAACPSSRDRAVVAVLASSALRRAELAGLDCADVVEQEGAYVLQVRRAKGGWQRVTPLAPDVADLVLGYLATDGRAPGTAGPLFWADGGPGARIAAWEVGELVHAAAKAAGLGRDAVSPHALRHTAAARCWRFTRDVRAVQRLLGHRSLATTERYLQELSVEDLRRAMPPLPRLAARGAATESPPPPARRRRVLVRLR